MMTRALSLLGLVALFTGCQDLPDVERLRCGNGIVEQQVDEDCDGRPAGSPYACGAIGGADACRFICVDTPCPTGWACGTDEICRASTGAFIRGDIVQLAGDTLDLGDLDGDGALDLVSQAQGQLRIAFGNPGGRFEDLHAVNIPALQARLTVTDTDEDGFDDVAFFSKNSLTILRGQSTRTLVPVHVPEAELPAVAQQATSIRTSVDPSHELLMLHLDGDALTLTLAGRELRADAVVEALGAGGPPTTPTTTQLDADPLDEIVLGREFGRTIAIFNIACAEEPDAPCEARMRHRIELQGGAKLTRSPPALADLDGDGFVDVIAVVDLPDSRAVVVGAGVEGGFAPLEVRPELEAAAGCAPGCMGAFAHFSTIQRVVDVIGDDRPDLITGLAIFEVTGEDEIELVQRHRQSEPLNILDPIDVDGDGQLDVVGFGAGEVTFLLSDGDRFTEVTTPQGSGLRPAFGDFDGDTRLDMAVWETTGNLLVSFNGAGGLPADPILVGRFDAPVLLTTTERRYPLALGLDRPDEIAVIANDGVTILYGDRGRQPAAFIGLLQETPAGFPPPTQLAIGRFEDGPLRALAYMAGGDALRVFDAALDDLSTLPFESVPAEGCINQQPIDFLSRVVDWDADGFDDLLQIEASRARVIPPNRWHLQVARRDAGVWRCLWNAAVESDNGPDGLLEADIDDSGMPDVLVLLSPSRSPQPLNASDEDARLMVWFNPEGDDAPGSPFAVQPNASAATLIDVGGVRTVMTFGDGRAWSLTWNGADFDVFDRFAVPDDVQIARAADLDADGIDDLLVKTSSGVIVYRQASCSAREAWLGSCTRPEFLAAP